MITVVEQVLMDKRSAEAQNDTLSRNKPKSRKPFFSHSGSELWYFAMKKPSTFLPKQVKLGLNSFWHWNVRGHKTISLALFGCQTFTLISETKSEKYLLKTQVQARKGFFFNPLYFAKKLFLLVKPECANASFASTGKVLVFL